MDFYMQWTKLELNEFFVVEQIQEGGLKLRKRSSTKNTLRLCFKPKDFAFLGLQNNGTYYLGRIKLSREKIKSLSLIIKIINLKM